MDANFFDWTQGKIKNLALFQQLQVRIGDFALFDRPGNPLQGGT